MNEQTLTDVFSGRAPFVVEHQISIPPEKIIWGVAILVGAGLLFTILKKATK